MDLEHISQDLCQLSPEDMQELSRRLVKDLMRHRFLPTTDMDLFITQNCNLRCDYCFVGDLPRRRADEEQLLRAVDLMLAENQPSKTSPTLVLFGGEPLLEKGLMQSVASYARERAGEMGKKMTFNVTTNGTLLDEDAMHLAKEFGFRYLVSVDGDRAGHDLHRRRPDGSGSFDSILEKIPLIRAWDPMGAGARVTVSPDTVGRLTDGVRELAEAGLDYFLIAPNEDATWSSESLEEYTRQVRELARFYLDSNAKGHRVRLAMFEEDLEALHKKHAKMWGCHAGRGRLAVDCEGRIFACAKFAGMDKGKGMFQLGTLETGITEWGARERLVNADPQTRHYCTDCKYQEYCSGGCLAENLRATGSMYRPSKSFCVLQQALLRTMEEIPEVTKVWTSATVCPYRLQEQCTLGARDTDKPDASTTDGFQLIA